MTTENYKLQKYSGQGEEIRAQSWIKLFELHCPDDTKPKVLFYHLQGRALEWYADEIAETTIINWNTVKQKFLARFGSTTATPLIDAQRIYLRQGQKVETYFQEKIRLLKQTSLTKAEQIQMLTNGLPAQWKVSLAPINFKEVEEWVEATLRLEAASYQVGRPNRVEAIKPSTHTMSPKRPPYPCKFCMRQNIESFHWHNECPNRKSDYHPKTQPQTTQKTLLNESTNEMTPNNPSTIHLN